MVLGNGARGTAVADLQRRLQALGFAVGGIDGIYGPQTAAAVRAFQQSRGLSVDGIAGPQTEGALSQEGAASGESVAAPATDGVTPLNPEDDPQYLAFMRAQGYAESDLRAQIALQKSTIQRDLAKQLPVLQANESSAAEGIGKNYLARGFWAGGEHLRDVALSNADYDRQINGAQSGAADQSAALDQQLASKISSDAQAQQEEQLAARKRLALGNASLT